MTINHIKTGKSEFGADKQASKTMATTHESQTMTISTQDTMMIKYGELYCK